MKESGPNPEPVNTLKFGTLEEPKGFFNSCIVCYFLGKGQQMRQETWVWNFVFVCPILILESGYVEDEGEITCCCFF